MEITAKEMRTLSPEDMELIQEEISLYRGAYIGNIMPKVLDDGNSVIVADIIATNASTVMQGTLQECATSMEKVKKLAFEYNTFKKETA